MPTNDDITEMLDELQRTLDEQRKAIEELKIVTKLLRERVGK